MRKHQEEGGGRTRHTHQCCLLDSFHCSRPDSRNAVRARTPCAHLAGALRRPPGRQSACGRRGRGTATKPGPEAPSPARPAGTAPHDALEAECHQRKCHWSCCNICSKKRRDTFVYKMPALCWVFTQLSAVFHLTTLVLPLCRYLCVFSDRHSKRLC